MHLRLRLLTAYLSGMLLVVAAFVAWILLRPPGVRIVLSPAQIQRTLDATFPVSSRYLDLIDLTYHDPHIDLGRDDHRVHLQLALSAVVAGHVLSGSAVGSACLRYQAVEGAIFLDRLILEQVAIAGVAPAFLERLQGPASELLRHHLETHPIYRLRGSSAREFEHLVIRDITLHDGNLVLTLGR